MNAYDFEYDGIHLSDLGYVICKFDSDGLQTITNGSPITFNTVSTLSGSKHELISSEYTSCLESTFHICKDTCADDDMEITTEELRYLASWLNRKGFHKFKLLHPGYDGLYFEASFNISKIELEDKIYGLELNLVTNRPFALRDQRKITINNLESNGVKSINDDSDEEGFIYPYTEIEIIDSGDLKIHNSIEDRTTFIKGCTAGEKIILDYPVIHTSIDSHKIQDDFNWVFLRIANTFRNSKNDLTISIPCNIKLTYSPIAKLGI